MGNKIDLPNKVITTEEAKELANKYKVNFFEVSALTGIGIDTIFENITNEIYTSKLKNKQTFEIDQGYSLEPNNNKGKKKLVITARNERFERRDDDGKSGECFC